MSRDDYLFCKHDWLAVDRIQRETMRKEVESMDPDQLLGTPVVDLVAFLSQKHSIEAPVLHLEAVSVEHKEALIDVSRDPFRVFSPGDGPQYAPATEIVVEVPFSGESAAFSIRPNPYTLSPPRARTTGSSVVFSVVGENLSADSVRNQINSVIQSIQDNLTNLRNNVAGLNRDLNGEAQRAVELRRNKLLASRNLVSSLGFHVRQRPGSASTYVAPEVRKKVVPTLPRVPAGNFKPEPTLATADYEHILGVMKNMTHVMERSPSAFHAADEETIRSHFLVQLNGHYEGQATGETFNYEGKTDILIRSDGRNVFIAECKFWSGPKKLLETIDQLLGYSSWRDTKTAVVLFNRNKSFSNVLSAIPATVESHPHCKGTLHGTSESEFRFRFSHKDDQSRELLLTVLAFDVPRPPDSASESSS